MGTDRRFTFETPDCPACSASADQVGVAVRNALTDLADVYPALDLSPGTHSLVPQVGWRCTDCGHEWGFLPQGDGTAPGSTAGGPHSGR